mmetsp:Transcript_12568/g.20911  ORF Transcript_12568/g.20911 Transcript_12568/m.20911 type:complete len:242 (-) Transcript_12568:37-762(-)
MVAEGIIRLLLIPVVLLLAPTLTPLFLVVFAWTGVLLLVATAGTNKLVLGLVELSFPVLPLLSLSMLVLSWKNSNISGVRAAPAPPSIALVLVGVVIRTSLLSAKPKARDKSLVRYCWSWKLEVFGILEVENSSAGAKVVSAFICLDVATGLSKWWQFDKFKSSISPRCAGVLLKKTSSMVTGPPTPLPSFLAVGVSNGEREPESTFPSLDQLCPNESSLIMSKKLTGIVRFGFGADINRE